MSSQQNKDTSIILKDVHCPYCDGDNALLITRVTSKRISLRMPSHGLKNTLSMLFLSLPYVWVHGYKLFEAVKELDSVTYGFCPNCGNSYSMAPPPSIKEETEEPKFRRVREKKAILGVCTAIAKHTGLSIVGVRVMMAFYGLTGIGAIFYFLFGLMLPFEEDVKGDE